MYWRDLCNPKRRRKQTQVYTHIYYLLYWITQNRGTDFK